MADRVCKRFYPWVFVQPHQLLLNKCLDLSTLSLRKVDNREKNGEKGGKREEENIIL